MTLADDLKQENARLMSKHLHLLASRPHNLDEARALCKAAAELVPCQLCNPVPGQTHIPVATLCEKHHAEFVAAWNRQVVEQGEPQFKYKETE